MKITRQKQRIVPYLIYEDAPAAINFLIKAFGFVERMRYPMPDGRIGHAEVTLYGETLMLASRFDGFGESPKNLPATHTSLYCYVDNVDAHFEHAKTSGATIIAEPVEDHGNRFYRALDPEGHRWIFATPLEGAS